jgi:hypothetical protein
MERWIEADTLALSRREGELSLHKPEGMLYRGQPPGDLKTLWRWTSQQREIRAWIRSREVARAYPRHWQVSEVVTPWNPLFFCILRHYRGFSGNI